MLKLSPYVKCVNIYSFFAFLMLALSCPLKADWLQVKAKVAGISTYSHTETILVTLVLSGTAVADCSNNTSFAISHSLSEEGRARMYSTLLAAQLAGKDVAIAFNRSGGCEPWDTNPMAYRTIVRISI